MARNDDLFWRFLMGVFAFFGSFTLTLILRGYVLVDLWEWFMVPLGLPTVGMAHALGIALLIELVTFQGGKDDDDDDDEFLMPMLKRFVLGALLILLVWLLGSMIHSFM